MTNHIITTGRAILCQLLGFSRSLESTHVTRHTAEREAVPSSPFHRWRIEAQRSQAARLELSGEAGIQTQTVWFQSEV